MGIRKKGCGNKGFPEPWVVGTGSVGKEGTEEAPKRGQGKMGRRGQGHGAWESRDQGPEGRDQGRQHL